MARVLSDLLVVSVANDADFPEFISKASPQYRLEHIYGTRREYVAAVQKGLLQSDVHKVLTRYSPQVVFISGWATPESFASLAWALSFNRAVVIMSESQESDAPRNSLKELVKRRVLSLCDAAFVGGLTHSKYVQRLGMPPSCVFLGYDAVDNEHFERGADSARSSSEAVRRRLALPQRYYLASGRFVPKKNFTGLIQAFGEAARKTVNPPSLVILGDGQERPSIHAAVDAAPTVDIHLPGFRGYDVLPLFYGLAELFIHVSKSEQWGLVINEAAASGLPIIASDSCGATHALVSEGENGFVVSATNPTSIAEALARAFALSEEGLTHMGKVSRSLVASWGPERFATGFRDAAEAAMQHFTPRQSVLAEVGLGLLARRRYLDVP